MIDTALVSKVKALTPTERLELIGVVRDSLDPTDIPVTEAEKALLDDRLKDVETNLSAESSWPELRARLRQRLP